MTGDFKAIRMDSKGEVLKKIKKYIIENPDVAGTLEDISFWWLQSEKVNDAINEVSVAIEKLCRQGVIKKTLLPDNTIVYRASKK